MDIEDFVESPGRDEMVREVRKKIDELGIEYLYLQSVRDWQDYGQRHPG